MWVRGLKRHESRLRIASKRSHPMWVRGLKLFGELKTSVEALSHPMWVRGLKLDVLTLSKYPILVAPYVGAWIETKVMTLPS